MGYIIRPIDPAGDAAGLASAMMSAMYEEKNWALNWHIPLLEITSGCTTRLPYTLTRARSERRHVMLVDETTGETVAYSRWLVPTSFQDRMWLSAQIAAPTPEQETQWETAYQSNMEDGMIKGANAPYMAAMGDPLETVNNEILAKEGEMLELDYLAVKPTHKRRGIASMMVRIGLEQADSWDLKTLVMAKENGAKVYEKLGFLTLKTMVLDTAPWGGTEGWTNSFMLKQPGQKK